jgi:hypothetical protein
MTSFIVNFILDLTERQSSAKAVQCNYQDNYYGDQVCVLKSEK